MESKTFNQVIQFSSAATLSISIGLSEHWDNNAGATRRTREWALRFGINLTKCVKNLCFLTITTTTTKKKQRLQQLLYVQITEILFDLQTGYLPDREIRQREDSEEWVACFKKGEMVTGVFSQHKSTGRRWICAHVGELQGLWAFRSEEAEN